jgi:hypothetical protein
MILGEMWVLLPIYWYVALFRLCEVRRVVVIISFSLLFSNYSTYVV